MRGMVAGRCGRVVATCLQVELLLDMGGIVTGNRRGVV